METAGSAHTEEAICAFRRLGTMFGCEKYNIKPDLVTLAKQLSSGYMPISAVPLGQHMFLTSGLSRMLSVMIGYLKQVVCNMACCFQTSQIRLQEVWIQIHFVLLVCTSQRDDRSSTSSIFAKQVPVPVWSKNFQVCAK